ncbi:P63C domain-containing protein [Devosia chinhatensis]|uniref:P63C domain-containing protein n=1 Tax=Devosia chinhatensis TaxID=429727 RepID=UPI001FCCF3FA|nr:P63C domain-containing protein [Devosia chinhatensis]
MENLAIPSCCFQRVRSRRWNEKTFPDELWEEFGRLTNWQGSLIARPKYWGKLVIELF